MLPSPPDDYARVRSRYTLALALTNAGVAVAFFGFDPGTAASLHFLQFLAPLPVWGAAFLIAAALLIARFHRSGHTVAVICWAMWAWGAVLGLGSSRSPAVTVALAALLVGLSAMHSNSLTARIRERRT